MGEETMSLQGSGMLDSGARSLRPFLVVQRISPFKATSFCPGFAMSSIHPSNFSTLVQEFGEHLLAQARQPATRESYCHDASSFCQYMQLHALSLKDLEPGTLLAYQDHVAGAQLDSINSIRRATIGIRQFFRFLVMAKHLPDSPFDAVAVPPRDERLPASLTALEVDSIIEAAEQSPSALKGARDVAIVAMLAFEGIKASELVGLEWHQLRDHGHDDVSLHLSGPRSRAIKLEKPSALALRAYRRLLVPSLDAIESSSSRHIFLGFRGGESKLSNPLSRHGLKFLVYELGKKIGHPHLNTELLRHFATEYRLTLGYSTEDIMIHFGLRRAGNVAKHNHLRKTLARLGEAHPSP